MQSNLSQNHCSKMLFQTAHVIFLKKFINIYCNVGKRIGNHQQEIKQWMPVALKGSITMVAVFLLGPENNLFEKGQMNSMLRGIHKNWQIEF